MSSAKTDSNTLVLTFGCCVDTYMAYFLSALLLQLSFSPRVSTSSHVKIVALLGGIILSSGGLLMICAVVGWQFGFSHFAFLCSEVRMYMFDVSLVRAVLQK